MLYKQLVHVCGCQNYGPFLGTLNIRCRIIIGIQKGTIILTTAHVCKMLEMEHGGGLLWACDVQSRYNPVTQDTNKSEACLSRL